MAANCWVVPTAMVGVAGVTAIDVTGATVNIVEPDTLPDRAEIVVSPMATADATPDTLMEAAPSFDELQTTVEVTS